MAPPKAEKSQLKRGRGSEDDDQDAKKVRRSQRLSGHQKTPISQKQHLPSPMTHEDSTSSNDAYKEGTATPPEGRPSQIQHRSPELASPTRGGPLASSPPQDTQAFSQPVQLPSILDGDTEDEDEDGVWGYLVPLDPKYGKTLTLRRRNACPLPDGMEDFGANSGKRQSRNGKKSFEKEEKAYEETKLKGIASGGYLIGRHPECGKSPSDDFQASLTRPRSANPRAHYFQQTLSLVHRKQGQ